MLVADNLGESNLSYTWSTTGSPPAAVSFSANGTNAAKNTTATFTKPGNYSFFVTIADHGGLSTTSSVNVTVNLTATSISVQSGSLAANGTVTFTAVANDQFGNSDVAAAAIHLDACRRRSAFARRRLHAPLQYRQRDDYGLQRHAQRQYDGCASRRRQVELQRQRFLDRRRDLDEHVHQHRHRRTGHPRRDGRPGDFCHRHGRQPLR